MTARQLATLILEALEVGDVQYIETLALGALEDDDGDEPDDEEDA